eukprot:CAMPEP_0185605686 /NCGR_PEP_ID=MMETSP0436-20130131/4234_1 /TAXON_ID=626734 ORGANISM="Favella taraikaensis, Strain Fe Narragansett Bay" /NCGR_SAMPLE_ID=MMETSP0436 /ASSEMBLY_ACC=CAM_ASM_000390 /LENGTH=277 /DNA_ID=CAMNT_0028236989 /DNA_START=360 /DNA_END=1191 /DNA_ORIENTATION=-
MPISELLPTARVLMFSGINLTTETPLSPSTDLWKQALRMRMSHTRKVRSFDPLANTLPSILKTSRVVTPTVWSLYIEWSESRPPARGQSASPGGCDEEVRRKEPAACDIARVPRVVLIQSDLLGSLVPTGLAVDLKQTDCVGSATAKELLATARLDTASAEREARAHLRHDAVGSRVPQSHISGVVRRYELVLEPITKIPGDRVDGDHGGRRFSFPVSAATLLGLFLLLVLEDGLLCDHLEGLQRGHFLVQLLHGAPVVQLAKLRLELVQPVRQLLR